MRRSSHGRGRMAGLLVVGVMLLFPPPSRSQDVKVHTPEQYLQERKAYSKAPAMVVPQLRKSLELAKRAQAIASVAQSSEELKEAAALVMEAYRLQRASHGGLSIQQRANTKPGSKLEVQDRTILASRHNLIGAQNEFMLARGRDMRRLERGLEYLRAAINQTQTLLTMRGAGG